MGGGGTTTTSTGRNFTKIPPWLKPLLMNTASGWEAAQKALPSLSELYNMIPELQVPNLSPAQGNIIGEMESLGNAAYNYLGGGPSVQPGQNVPGSSGSAGFAKGGSFDIPGQGQEDNQLVQFLARPGEKVTVITPEQQEMLKKMGVPGFAAGGQMQVPGKTAQASGKGTGQNSGQGSGKGTGNNSGSGKNTGQNNGQNGGLNLGGNGVGSQGIGASGTPPPGITQQPVGPAFPTPPGGGATGNPIGGPTNSGGNGVLDPQQLEASKTLESFLGTPGTPSAATTAEMKLFDDLEAPKILQSSANMGLGTSGAALQALALGQEAAAVPFLQGDLQNTLNATEQLGQIGAQGAQQAQQQIANALQAAGIPYEVALQQAQALYNQLSNKFNFGEQIQMGPANLFGNLFGSQTTGSSTTQQPKF